MGKNSQIEWTHHTFNPWWGCTKVSPACKNCYAEAWAKRVGCSVWGYDAKRRLFGKTHWNEPVRWNAEAKSERARFRVFCASMADVFERRSELNPEREKLWALIENTPYLDWLLLTKRPQQVSKLVKWTDDWPDNVWLGTTVENQNCLEERLPELLAIPAKTRFLSCEPLLGDLDLSSYVKSGATPSIHWIIAGGESGANARPMNPQWVRNLRDFCNRHDVAFHFKQWGHWAPSELLTSEQRKTITIGNTEMAAAGKKSAGRVLDGRTWDELPRSA